MADLDSRSKRASSVRWGLCFLLALPLPDATISQADRQHIAADYSGILAAAPASPEPRLVAFTTWNVSDTLRSWNLASTVTSWNVSDTFRTTDS